jgi:hypothetical protein
MRVLLIAGHRPAQIIEENQRPFRAFDDRDALPIGIRDFNTGARLRTGKDAVRITAIGEAH